MTFTPLRYGWLLSCAWLAAGCVSLDAETWDKQLLHAVELSHGADVERAEDIMRWAVRVAEADLRDPGRAAIASYYLGDLMHTYPQYGEPESTRLLLERGLAHWESELGKEALPLVAILTRLGENAHERGDQAAAAALFARSDAIVEKHLPKGHRLRRARRNGRRPEYALHPEELRYMDR